jgi:hypothetical protein
MHWWPKIQISGTGLTIVSTVAPALGYPIPFEILLALLIFGAILIAWPIVVGIFNFVARGFRTSFLKLSLERDSESDQLGVQTFPGVTFIQISVKAVKKVANCRVDITRIEFAEKNSIFAMQHNESRFCRWSDREKLEVDLTPAASPVRCNVAIFNSGGLQLYPTTPTNLLPRLQQIGTHRFFLNFYGECEGRAVSQQAKLAVNWRGRDKLNSVSLES